MYIARSLLFSLGLYKADRQLNIFNPSQGDIAVGEGKPSLSCRPVQGATKNHTLVILLLVAAAATTITIGITAIYFSSHAVLLLCLFFAMMYFVVLIGFLVYKSCQVPASKANDLEIQEINVRADLEKRIQVLEAEKKTTETKMKTITEENVHLKTSVEQEQKYKGEYDDFFQQKQVFTTEKETFEKEKVELSDLKEKYARMEKNNDDLTSLNVQLLRERTLLKEVQIKLENCEKEKKRCEKEKEELNALYLVLEKGHGTMTQKNADQILLLEQENKTKDINNAELQKRINKSTTETRTLTEKCDKQEKKIKKLQDEKKDLEKKNKTSQNVLENFMKKHADLTNQYNDLYTKSKGTPKDSHTLQPKGVSGLFFKLKQITEKGAEAEAALEADDESISY